MSVKGVRSRSEHRKSRCLGGRHSGLTVSALDSGSNGPLSEALVGALRCVLGQVTLLS